MGPTKLAILYRSIKSAGELQWGGLWGTREGEVPLPLLVSSSLLSELSGTRSSCLHASVSAVREKLGVGDAVIWYTWVGSAALHWCSGSRHPVQSCLNFLFFLDNVWTFCYSVSAHAWLWTCSSLHLCESRVVDQLARPPAALVPVTGAWMEGEGKKRVMWLAASVFFFISTLVDCCCRLTALLGEDL